MQKLADQMIVASQRQDEVVNELYKIALVGVSALDYTTKTFLLEGAEDYFGHNKRTFLGD